MGIDEPGIVAASAMTPPAPARPVPASTPPPVTLRRRASLNVASRRTRTRAVVHRNDGRADFVRSRERVGAAADAEPALDAADECRARLPRDAIREPAPDAKTLLALHVPVDAARGCRPAMPTMTRCVQAVFGPNTPDDAALRLPHGDARLLLGDGLPNVLRRQPDFLAQLDELFLGHRLAGVAGARLQLARAREHALERGAVERSATGRGGFVGQDRSCDSLRSRLTRLRSVSECHHESRPAEETPSPAR